MKRRFLSLLVLPVIVMMAGCTVEDPDPVTPDPDPEPTPEPYVLFGGGDGSEASPYLIRSTDEYQKFVHYVDSAYYTYGSKCWKVTESIDLTDKAVSSVGTSDQKPFKGVFDGNGQTIKGFTLKSSDTAPCAMFGYLEGATVKNFTLADANVDGASLYTAGVAGYVSNSTVEGVKLSGQVRNYTSALKTTASDIFPVATNNAGCCGGIVGIAVKSTVKDCSLDGNVTFYGKFSGGVVGYSYNSTVENCSVEKNRTVNVYYHYNGGVIGRAMGADNVIKGCSFEGNLTSVGYCQGGIVGQLFGGKVQDCVLGSYGNMGSDKFFVGGIVGSAQSLAEITIDNCACYGQVKGAYSVAGIVGYVGPGSGATSDTDLMMGSSKANQPVTISNCAMIGGTITATSGNSNKYPIAGGIVGWSHGALTYNLRGCYSLPGLIQTTYGANTNGVLSGISSYQNNSGGSTIENCYSAFAINNFLICNDQPANDGLWYAAITIRCTGVTSLKNCYSESTMRYNYSNGSTYTESGCGQYTATEMTDGTLLKQLQATAVTGTTWVAGTNGYPTLAGLPADPHVKPQAAKRVSVIGDSISTFKGFIPGGYSAHYPATDGSLTLVNETYWYRLIYDHMKNAEFDTNIAFSGSTVTNTTSANYTAKYGSNTNAWWHNSFSERFAACGGCGKPDIILIHGGTNDWAHNADPLAPDVAIRNESGNIYGGLAPSSSVMASIYATADAAKTRTEINALPDGTFCEAYVKLLCQIRERYPQCKVVCIIGDYLSQSIELSVIDIAGHYGAKTVDLFRVNGFNDLGGYTESTLKLGVEQPNMPKHDHTDLNVTTGCHPGSKAMDFIATKIYDELGAWLEE